MYAPELLLAAAEELEQLLISASDAATRLRSLAERVVDRENPEDAEDLASDARALKLTLADIENVLESLIFEAEAALWPEDSEAA
jgi:hypothetical protein